MQFLLFGCYSDYAISPRDGYLGRYGTRDEAVEAARGERGEGGNFDKFEIFNVIDGRWDEFPARGRSDEMERWCRRKGILKGVIERMSMGGH
jgi:hypothetical protein